MYQGARVGRQCAMGNWLPCSAQMVPVHGVKFCWYDEWSCPESPLNWSVVWTRWDLLLLWSRSYLHSIDLWFKMYTGNMETEHSSTNPRPYMKLASTYETVPTTYLVANMCARHCVCVFLANIVGIWCTVMLHFHEYYFYSDHEEPGRPVCFWWSSALLSVACKVDRTAAGCRATAQSAAARSKGTLQFLLHPTSFIATTTNTSRYVYIHYSSMHIS